MLYIKIPNIFYNTKMDYIVLNVIQDYGIANEYLATIGLTSEYLGKYDRFISVDEPSLNIIKQINGNKIYHRSVLEHNKDPSKPILVLVNSKNPIPTGSNKFILATNYISTQNISIVKPDPIIQNDKSNQEQAILAQIDELQELMIQAYVKLLRLRNGEKILF